MDRELPLKVIRARKMKKASLFAAPVAIVLLAFWGLSLITQSSINRSRIRTAVVELGAVESTVSASGRVVPAFEQVITSPVASVVESVYVKTGDSVDAGTPLLSLDCEALLSSRTQTANELELQRTKKKQMMLQLERQQIDLTTSREIKKLQVEHAQTEYNREKELLGVGGTTEQKLLEYDLAAQVARKELEKLEAEITNQEQTHQADLKAIDLQIEIEKSRMADIDRKLELARARAPRPSVVTWINDDIGASVVAGEPLVRLADLSRFRVDASISDVHGDKLTVGGLARLRVGKERLSGRIKTIQPSVKEGVVSFTIELDQPSNPILRPNLRADVQVVTGGVENVMRVVNGPFYDGLRDQTVFVIESGRAVAHTVDIGASNIDWVEVSGDVAPGDTVIISDMRRYRNASSLTIKEE